MSINKHEPQYDKIVAEGVKRMASGGVNAKGEVYHGPVPPKANPFDVSAQAQRERYAHLGEKAPWKDERPLSSSDNPETDPDTINTLGYKTPPLSDKYAALKTKLAVIKYLVQSYDKARLTVKDDDTQIFIHVVRQLLEEAPE